MSSCVSTRNDLFSVGPNPPGVRDAGTLIQLKSFLEIVPHFKDTALPVISFRDSNGRMQPGSCGAAELK